MIAIAAEEATQGLVEGCGRRQRDEVERSPQSLLPVQLAGVLLNQRFGFNFT
jgi:hypothetical protein